MVRLIMGVKGSGKTKQLIELINNAAKDEPGNVVCIEANRTMTYDIHYHIRLIDAQEYNLDSYELLVDGKRVDTPPKELELLYFLASSPNQVFTREQLLDNIWGYEYAGDTRTVDVHIKRIMEKHTMKKSYEKNELTFALVWIVIYCVLQSQSTFCW